LQLFSIQGNHSEHNSKTQEESFLMGQMGKSGNHRISIITLSIGDEKNNITGSII
jgi:hypothetical protein